LLPISAGELIESGCDYITATAARTGSVSQLYDFGQYLVRESVKAGSKERQSRAGGYYNSVADGIQVGRRYDGVCVRASSVVAREHWNQILDLSENITRFDVQLTERLSVTPAERMAEVWSMNPGTTSGTGRHSEVKQLVGKNGCEILRIASRSSERYMRIYDKWLDTRDPHYLNALRWELELKGEIAKQFAIALSFMDQPDAAMLQEILAFTHRKLSTGPSADYLRECNTDEIMCRHSPRPARECIRTLIYLEKSIRPCVRRLIDAGYLDQVIAALDLPDAKPTE